ncbi:MAG: 2-oxo acid dehydrogenase subunit E2 [Moraxellaceae bacterium]
MDIKTPDLGVDKAEVIEILVKVGDQIEAGQSLFVVESSKASVEIPSPAAGVVQQVLVKLGDVVSEDVLLLKLADAASKPAPSATEQPDAASQTESTAQAVERVEVANTADTKHVQSDDTVQPKTPDIAKSTAPLPTQTPSPVDLSSVYAGPAVRQAARQLGVDLREVQGSGTHQRILKEDVYAYIKQRLNQPVVPSAVAVNASPVGLPPLPNMDKWGELHAEPLSRLQQAAIRHLALNTYIPQVTQFEQADITELEALRQQLKDDYKKSGVSLTILAFIAKAVAHLLLQQPRFNSHLADDGKQLIVRDEVHLGIAVATDDGLIVPVLRHPDRKGIRQIAEELQQLGQKAREQKLTPADLSGASFTISSLGNLGGTGFTPLVNWPQVAILGISPAAMQPVWDGAQFVPRLLLPLSLSYDHRVINGADAAGFASQLALLLADLRRVLL